MEPTSYRVLARKYRPAVFSDLIGQEVLVRTLTNAIASNRLAHAFLLTGIRGVGKTTTARIIARALGCIGADGKGGPTSEPCGVCSNCKMIAEDRHPDVIEMDAASHTGVNDIRDIIDSVHYSPSSARYKIYIIDEVHMLSTNAFNALLKTLEEPPPHVKFIFATTELRKIPVTILSRCQRFDLRRVDVETLEKHLRGVAEKEQVSVEDEALKLISTVAEGSVRDSLSLLDQAIAHSLAPDAPIVIKTDTVRSMLGMADKTRLFELLDSLLRGDIATTLAQLQTLVNAGTDPVMLLQDLLELTHFITQIRLAPPTAASTAYSESERGFAQKLAESLSIPQATRLWQMLLKGLSETRLAPNPLSAAEMIVIRCAHASTLPSPAEIIRSVQSGSPIAQPQQRGMQTPQSSAAAPRDTPRSNVSLISTQQTMARSAPELQPTAQATLSLQRFEDVVALFEQKKEPLLYNYLVRESRLVSFAEGRVELNVSQTVPVDFAGKVGKLLTDWAGKRWVVALSHDQGQSTLHEKAEARNEQRKEELSHHPLVESIMQQFPGAKITDIAKE